MQPSAAAGLIERVSRWVTFQPDYYREKCHGEEPPTSKTPVRIRSADYGPFFTPLPPGTKHHFAIGFPGDRLGPNLLKSKALFLTEEDKKDFHLMNDINATGAASIGSPMTASGSFEALHALDMQEPRQFANLMASAIPLGPTTAKARLEEIIAKGPDEEKPSGERPISSIINGLPKRTPSSEASELWHYLVVFPQTITPCGQSVYTQFFPQDCLTSNGEPVIEAYGDSLVAYGQSQLNASVSSSSSSPVNFSNRPHPSPQLRGSSPSSCHTPTRTCNSTPAPPPIGNEYDTNQTNTAYPPNPHPALTEIERLCLEHLQRIRAISIDAEPALLSECVASVHLVGFSKGTVVLNEIIAEMGGANEVTDEPLLARAQRRSSLLPGTPGGRNLSISPSARSCSSSSVANSISPQRRIPFDLGIHYVDGGLNTVGAFFKERKTLDTFLDRYLYGRTGESPQEASQPPPLGPFLLSPSRCCSIVIDIYSTPRQRNDPRRPWLDAERRLLGMLLSSKPSMTTKPQYYQQLRPDSQRLWYSTVLPGAFRRTGTVQGRDKEPPCSENDEASTPRDSMRSTRDSTRSNRDAAVSTGVSQVTLTTRVLEDDPRSGARGGWPPTKEDHVSGEEGLRIHMMAMTRFALKAPLNWG